MNIDIMSCFMYDFMSVTLSSPSTAFIRHFIHSYLYLISEITCKLLNIYIDKHSEVLGSVTLCEQED